VVGLVAFSLAAPALAFDGIAPAGPCGFELRGFQAATPVSSAVTEDADDPTTTSVTIGPSRTRLTPAHVASGPPSVAVGAPQPGPLRGVGPCDNPGSGCLGPVQPSPLASASAPPPAPAVAPSSAATSPVFIQPDAGQGSGSDPFPGTSP
jgi:hypothetical protein